MGHLNGANLGSTPTPAGHAPRGGNYVTEGRNYVTDNPSNLGNYVTADTMSLCSSEPVYAADQQPRKQFESHRGHKKSQFRDPTWLKLVHTAGADLDERVAEVVG